MASNNEYSNLFPDWSDWRLIEEIPSDLEDVKPFNPNFPNCELRRSREVQFVGIDQPVLSNWGDDPYVGVNIEGNNLQMNGEGMYSRSLSPSPGGRQLFDLQNPQLIGQCKPYNLQQQTVDTASDFNNSNSTSQMYSLFPSDGITPRQPSEATSVRVNRRSCYGFVGEPGNNGALGLSEPSLSIFGSCQDHLNKSSETPRSRSESILYPSSMEASPSLHQAGGGGSPSSSSSHSSSQGSPRPTCEPIIYHCSMEASPSLHQAGGGRSSSSSSSHSSSQESPRPGKNCQFQKRVRISTAVYNALTDEQKLARKREKDRTSSKKHAAYKRQQKMQLKQDFEALNLRHTGLSRILDTLKKRKQVLEEANSRLCLNNNTVI